MISLTKLSGRVFVLNADLIERIDATPDTVITLVDGKKYVVAQTTPQVIDAVIAYRGKVRAERAAQLDRARSQGAPAPRRPSDATQLPLRAVRRPSGMPAR